MINIKILKELIDEEAEVYNRDTLTLAAALAARVDWIDECYEGSAITK